MYASCKFVVKEKSWYQVKLTSIYLGNKFFSSTKNSMYTNVQQLIPILFSQKYLVLMICIGGRFNQVSLTTRYFKNKRRKKIFSKKFTTNV